MGEQGRARSGRKSERTPGAVGAPSQSPTPLVVVGIGHRWHTDEAAGLVAARRLADMLPSDVGLVTVTGGFTALVEAWEGATAAVLVDAVRSRAEPGTIRRFDASAAALPPSLATATTHGLGVPQALELARALGVLPRRIVLVGVEGRSFRHGTGLSAEVEDALPALLAEVCAEVERLRAGMGSAPP